MHVLPVLALALIDAYDTQIDEVERTVLTNAKINDPVTLKLLRTIPGIGQILSLVLLYEIDQITRLPAVGNFPGSSSPAK
jgi:transposase